MKLEKSQVSTLEAKITSVYYSEAQFFLTHHALIHEGEVLHGGAIRIPLLFAATQRKAPPLGTGED